MRARISVAILVASLGWGSGGVATRAAFDQGVEPFALSLLRTLFAAVAIVGYLVLSRRTNSFTALTIKVGVVMGITNLAAPFVLFTLAYQYASAGFVGLLAALIPLMTAGLAHVLLPDERLQRTKLLGLAVALAGVAFLLASGDSGLAGEGRPLLSFGLGAAAVLSISYASIYAKRYAGQYRSLDVTTVQFLVGLVVLVAATVVAEGVPGTQTAAGWALLVYLAIASTFVPFLVYYWLLRHVTATYASVIGYVVPLVAVVGGLALLDERLQVGIAVGGLLILAGVVLTDRAESRLVRV